jgi:hypothetical protein
LKAKPRKRKGEKSSPPTNETPEQRAIRIMEENFTVYDFSKVDHDSITAPTSEDQVIDLCEKSNYHATSTGVDKNSTQQNTLKST